MVGITTTCPKSGKVQQNQKTRAQCPHQHGLSSQSWQDWRERPCRYIGLSYHLHHSPDLSIWGDHIILGFSYVKISSSPALETSTWSRTNNGSSQHLILLAKSKFPS